MQCPHCKHKYTHVYSSKNLSVIVKRYRKCLQCGHTFRTVEEIYETPITTTLIRQKNINEGQL